MTGVGLSSLCTCGSGKSFKSCCGSNVLIFPSRAEARLGSRASRSRASRERAARAKRGASIASEGARVRLKVEPLNPLASSDVKRLNNLSYGLSIEQMASILAEDWDLNNPIFNFFPQAYAQHFNPEKEGFLMPRLALFALSCVADFEELAQVENNTLSSEFYDFVLDEFFGPHKQLAHNPFMKENIMIADQLLTWAGLIQKNGSRFVVTAKGAKVIEELDMVSVWAEFMELLFIKWSWSDGPRFYYRDMMQSTFVFLIYLLHQKAQKWLSCYEVFEAYVQAFPHILMPPEGGATGASHSPVIQNRLLSLIKSRPDASFEYKEEAFGFFCSFIVGHILEPMGLVNLKPHSSTSTDPTGDTLADLLDAWKNMQLKVTPCFKDAFVFHPTLRPLSSRPQPSQHPF